MLHDIIIFIVDIVRDLGYIGIFIMMTLESSFFPFPSEVALIPAWYWVSQWEMNFYLAFGAGLWWSLFWAYINYALWKYLWKPFLLKYWKYVFFKEESYNKSEKYFKSHWTITTFLGRLIPVFRQYISFPAGVFSMNLPKFLFYTWLGAGIWWGILIAIWYIAWENQDLISEYSHLAIYWAVAFVILSGLLYFVYNKYFKKKIKKEVSVLVIFNKQWQILMQDRKTMSKVWEMWWFFGWKLEKGETKEEALIREIKEELNIELKTQDYNYIYTKDNYWVKYWAYVRTNYFFAIMDKEEDEFSVFEWDWAVFFNKEEILKNYLIWRENREKSIKKTIDNFYKFYNKNIK